MFKVASLASGLGTIPVTANLNFWSRAIFRNLPLPEKCTDPKRNDMRTQSICGFFLTWVGSYENHCFGTNAHTFVFQVGHPTSGGSRNLERGVQSPAREARRKFLGCHVHFRSRERIHTIKYSWKAEPRGPSQKKSRTLSDSVVLVNYNFN